MLDSTAFDWIQPSTQMLGTIVGGSAIGILVKGWLDRHKTEADATATESNASANFETMVNARISEAFSANQDIAAANHVYINNLKAEVQVLRDKIAQQDDKIAQQDEEIIVLRKSLDARGEACPFRDSCDGPKIPHPLAPHLPG